MNFLKISTVIILCWMNHHASADSLKLKSIDEVIAKFQEVTTSFEESKNHRLVFATTYLDSTIELRKEIEKNSFQNPTWVETIVVEFANLYIDSLKGYEKNSKIAISWKEAFKINDERYHKLSVQLLLAMNAHIYHDLPIALLKSFERGYDPLRLNNDFLKMNDVFERLTPKFMSLLYDLESFFGMNNKGIKDWIIFRVVKSMRADAWDLGVELYKKSSYHRDVMLKKIDLDAGDNAHFLINNRFLIPAH